MKRKVMIVLEETGEFVGKDQKFNIYLAGDTERLGKTDMKDLSVAESWGLRLFNVCKQVLAGTGTLKTVNGVPLESIQPPSGKEPH